MGQGSRLNCAPIGHSYLCSPINDYLFYSFEYADKDGRTPIMIAAMLNKHRKLAILLDTYTSLSSKLRSLLIIFNFLSIIEILTECLFTPDKPYHGNLYKNLMGKY